VLASIEEWVLNHEQEALKNEVTLPDDEPKLVRLMIDYLYQLDYNDTSGPQDGHAPTGEIDERASSLIPEPVSPVAQAIIDFEELSAPAAPTAEEVGDVDFAPFRKGKKGKRKKPASLAWDDEPAPPVDFEPKESELSIHAHMYELAEKYGIHDLKDLARTKFAESVSEKWNGSEFPLAIRIVYATTPENDNGLRDVVVETISQHKELLSEGSVEEVVKDINGLAFALLKSAWAY
jgi:hypothetical protein